MNEKIAVITDSCADIPQVIRESKGIHTIPVLMHYHGKDYHDGVDITVEDIYPELEHGDLPKTSLPSEEELIALLDSLKAQGCTHAAIITMSSAISGTFQMIKLICEEYEGMTCQAFDSGMAAIAEGALAIELADEIAAGLTWDRLPQRMARLKANTHPFFGLDTLKFLMRGGRIGKVTAIAGEILNIKPILSFDAEGVIDAVERCRGRKALIKSVAERICTLAAGKHRYRFYFADGYADADREALEQRILSVCREYTDIVRSKVGSALTVHLGPGLVGVAIQLLDE